MEIGHSRESTRSRRAWALGLVLVALSVAPQAAEACAVCYGDADSGMTQGLNNGILSLLGVIAVVQVGFVALFVSIRRRARLMEQREDCFQVIRGGAG